MSCQKFARKKKFAKTPQKKFAKFVAKTLKRSLQNVCKDTTKSSETQNLSLEVYKAFGLGLVYFQTGFRLILQSLY